MLLLLLLPLPLPIPLLLLPLLLLLLGRGGGREVRGAAPLSVLRQAGTHLHGGEIVQPHDPHRLSAGYVLVQGVAKRVRRIGTDHQCPARACVRVCESECECVVFGIKNTSISALYLPMSELPTRPIGDALCVTRNKVTWYLKYTLRVSQYNTQGKP